MWFLKPPGKKNLVTLRPRVCRNFNVALNERAPTCLVTAQSAERRDVWSSWIHNEWKERKTTQRRGQIRLSETIFKIWVRVQAITSLSPSLPLTIALHSFLCNLFLLHLVPLPSLCCFTLLQLYLLTHFTYSHLYFIHPLCLSPFCLSFFSLYVLCAV